MKSVDQINKIKAIVLYILQHFKDGVDYIKLFKIMYFAQREYLATYGLTMIEDTFKARPRGPVPALTYKVVKMAEEGNPEKSDLSPFISALRVDDNQMIYGVETPDMDYIAKMEKSELDTVIAKYAGMDSDALSELSHDSAYKKVELLMKDDPQKDVMTLIDIARAGGASKEMVSHIREVQLVKAALAS
jgi:uncharacterized phage-associated protein